MCLQNLNIVFRHCDSDTRYCTFNDTAKRVYKFLNTMSTGKSSSMTINYNAPRIDHWIQLSKF